MAKTSTPPIEMRLHSINEVSFSMKSGLTGNEDRGDELQLGFMNRLNPEIEKDMFSMDFGIQYTLNGQVLLECIYQFVFDIKSLSEYVIINESGKIHVKDIMPHMVSVAVGTMRGILVVKTAGTDLSKYPIPMIDPIELCKNFAK